MNVSVVYCNHESADIALRERLAFASESQLEQAYGELRQRFPNSEHVVVSTCNRVEVYSAQERSEDAPTQADVARFFSEFHKIPISDFFDDLLERTGPAAVQHLFEVACSLDSMVLGENQIVSQVKSAYEIATRTQSNGPLTNALFQRALQVSGRVRSETRLSEGRISIASVAVGEFGKSIFDRFSDKTVLVIGAGEMAEETLRYLQDEGVKKTIVCNRSLAKAETLAASIQGEARPFSQLDELVAQVDIIVSATGADQPILTAEQFRQIRRQAADRVLFILDLGAPRDFDPAIAHCDDSVFLYDIDDLEETCRKNRALRSEEIAKARRIIEEETARFMQDVYHKATGPIVKRLREEWHNISRNEIDLLFKKLGHLSEADRAAIERSVERIVNKLLHPPLQTLREEAKEGTPHGLLETLRRLFHLTE